MFKVMPYSEYCIYGVYDQRHKININEHNESSV